MGHSTAEESAVVHELDVVSFDVPIGAWAAGTRGTVVDWSAAGGTVEVSDESGRMLDLVTVSYENVTVVWSMDHEQVL